MGVIRNCYVGCKPIVGRFDRLFCSYIAELHIYATELLLNIPMGLAILNISAGCWKTRSSLVKKKLKVRNQPL